MPDQPRRRTHARGYDPRSTTAKGLGWAHQKQVKRLKAQHIEGTPCPICHEPMYLSQGLTGEHSKPRSLGGHLADCLAHAPCNYSRGNGTRGSSKAASEPARRPRTTREW